MTQDTCISTLRLIANPSTRNAFVASRTSTLPIACVPISKASFLMIRSTDEPCLRSTMAWGLEARVPFLDKEFLEVALNVDAKDKMFSKGSSQQFDEDGRPKMEKVLFWALVPLPDR